MASSTLPPRLCEGIQKYLDVEERILQRMLELIRALSGSGVRVPQLGEHQSELASLVADLSQMQVHRQNLRQALAQAWNCAPAAVRLSRVELDSAAATARVQKQREKLQNLARDVAASLQATERTLRGWSSIVGFLLSELLGTTGTSDRYAANGQRVASTHLAGIDVRT